MTLNAEDVLQRLGLPHRIVVLCGGGTTPTPAETRRITKTELQFRPGDLQLYLGAAGVTFSPWRTLLVSANLLFPLTDAGLRDRVTPVIAI